MKFIDEATIIVESGTGGNGCVSFRREKFVPRGGPDGGDGGKGGDVILRSGGQRTLHHFIYKRQFKGQRGGHGQGAQKTGKNGADIIIEVPAGTLVKDAETGEILKDFTKAGEEWIVLKGGRGGCGNRHFKTATHQTPRFAQPGEAGQKKTLRLELKLLADVGIVGLPNAGKSSLIAAISGARPAIGDYPFTTLTPTLGVVSSPWGDPFIVADIPGLIEGAAQGAGLGHRFLRHLERTRLLVHLVDASAIEQKDPLALLRTVQNELLAYNEALAQKPHIVVLNKMDLEAAQEGAKRFRKAAPKMAFLKISAHTGQGLDALVEHMAGALEKLDAAEEENQ